MPEEQNQNSFSTYALITAFVLILIATPAFIFYTLAQPIPSFVAISKIIGNERIQQEEIIDILDNMNLNNKRFVLTSRKQISQKLTEHPLIQKVRIKYLLFPKKQVKIFIYEHQPWAIIGEKIFDQELEILSKSRLSQSLYGSMKNLYEDFASSTRKSLVKIYSKIDLSMDDLLNLKNVSQYLNLFLHEFVSDDLFQKNHSEIIEIKIDRQKNIVMKSKKYFFKIGVVDDSLAKRLARLEKILDFINNYEEKQNIYSFDLSLNTDDVIIKKNYNFTHDKSS